MKKLTKLLAVLSIAFFAAACSDSPMGPQFDDSSLNSAEAKKGSWTATTDQDKTNTTKTKLPVVERATSGYALGM